LAMVENSILNEPFRRLAGASPSYADGILICPTSAGAVVAVDLATRSLLWGYRYARTQDPNTHRRMIAMRLGGYRGMEPIPRWFDATAAVVEGRVLLTPVESEWLHCLNLVDGKLLWKHKRTDELYLACVYQGKVVLAGKSGVRALRLADGKPAWNGRPVALPEASMPSGRGFLAGDRYYLPLSTAEVVAIDLDAGEISHVSKSRKGNVPGNLVCYKGKVISQGFDGVEMFYQLDPARKEVEQRLAANPDDAEAVSLRGEILLDEKKQAEAIACFRRAYALDKGPRTRDLLRDALLDGLRLKFAQYRDQSKEIESLLDDSQQRATYVRLTATGLHRAGEWQPAFQQYQKLIALDEKQRRMESVSGSVSVRRDRWLRARLATLRLDADGEAAAEIDRAIEARLKAALKTQEVDPLRRFLEYFGSHGSAAEARRQLVRRLADAGRLLEAEWVLWRQQRSGDPAVAGAAVAELAELLGKAGRDRDAAWCYRRLAGEFADVVCRGGKTGRQLADELPQDAGCEDLKAAWPVGRVKIEKPKTSQRSRVSGYGRFGLRYRGSRQPFFHDLSIRCHTSPPRLAAYDGLGNQRWQLALATSGQRRTLLYHHTMTHARPCAHLLLLSTGQEITAVDTLGSSGDGKPAVLWSRNLNEAGYDAATLRQLPLRPVNVPKLPRAQVSASAYGAGACNVGPVTENYVCFQRYRNLIAVEPITGEILWVRHDIPWTSLLFGDEQYVFARPLDKREAMVFRATDGELLGKRKFPPFGGTEPVALVPGIRAVSFGEFEATGFATLGRNVLGWHAEGSRRVLELFDVWQQRHLWPPRKFDAGAKACIVGHEAVGVLQRDGRFVLLNLPDGRTLVDVKLEPEKSLQEIVVLPWGDRYILVTHGPRPDGAANRLPMQPLPGTLPKLISHGRVYAFDRQGKLLWPKPAEIDDQHLLMHQPGRLPVLIFGCQVYRREPNKPGRYRVSILCLDKRTGRKLPEQTFDNTTSVFQVVGDPKKHTVEFHLQRNTVTMTFTDQPIPPSTKKDGNGA